MHILLNIICSLGWVYQDITPCYIEEHLCSFLALFRKSEDLGKFYANFRVAIPIRTEYLSMLVFGLLHLPLAENTHMHLDLPYARVLVSSTCFQPSFGFEITVLKIPISAQPILTIQHNDKDSGAKGNLNVPEQGQSSGIFQMHIESTYPHFLCFPICIQCFLK